MIAHQGRIKHAGQRLGSLIAAGELSQDVVGEENTLYFLADASLAGDPAAIARLTEISEAGETFADMRLGDVYLQGAGVDADPAQAARYFSKAARAGYAHAQMQLAELYAAGKGVDQDMIEAHKWANVAAANGLDAGVERRDTFAKLMIPDEIAEAQARARTYMKNP